jgi:SnoaL-like domain
MSDFAELAEQYIAAWNETDPSARRALIEEIWSEDGRYIDPLADVAGRDQIDAVIAAAQQQFAGMTFRLAGPVDAHHDQARFTWQLGPGGADAVVVGFDVAQRDAGGRLALVLGFLDKVPSP